MSDDNDNNDNNCMVSEEENEEDNSSMSSEATPQYVSEHEDSDDDEYILPPQPAFTRQVSYSVHTADSYSLKMNELAEEISQLLGIDAFFSKLLLQKHKWSDVKLKDKFFENPESFLKLSGIVISTEPFFNSTTKICSSVKCCQNSGGYKPLCTDEISLVMVAKEVI